MRRAGARGSEGDAAPVRTEAAHARLHRRLIELAKERDLGQFNQAHALVRAIVRTGTSGLDPASTRVWATRLTVPALARASRVQLAQWAAELAGLQ